MKGCILEVILKDNRVNLHSVYRFVGPELWVEISSKKTGKQKEDV